MNQQIEEILKNEKITDMINKEIQNELRYETDNITSEAWLFLEEECPSYIAQRIIESGDALDDITQESISWMLKEIMFDYETKHANIRIYEDL